MRSDCKSEAIAIADTLLKLSYSARSFLVVDYVLYVLHELHRLDLNKASSLFCPMTLSGPSQSLTA